MLQIITPEVAGDRGMFTCMKHALTKASVWHLHLTADVQNEIDAWRDLTNSPDSRPTHLRDLEPSTPTWVGATKLEFLDVVWLFPGYSRQTWGSLG